MTDKRSRHMNIADNSDCDIKVVLPSDYRLESFQAKRPPKFQSVQYARMSLRDGYKSVRRPLHSPLYRCRISPITAVQCRAL